MYRITPDKDGVVHLFVDQEGRIGDFSDFRPVTMPEGFIREDGDRAFDAYFRRHGWVTERTVYSRFEFSHPFVVAVDLPCVDSKNGVVRRVFDFSLKKGEPLTVRLAFSTSLGSAARANLDRDLKGRTFDEVRAAASEAWEDVLSRVRIDGTDSQKKAFYTSVYHLFFQPNEISDYGEKPFYSTLSCWDTFRASHPLYTILCPEKIPGYVESILEQGRRMGFLPIWTLWGADNQCMIGVHSIPILVDAYLKGFPGDWEEAWRQIRDTQTVRHPIRYKEDWKTYDAFGYFPYDLVPLEGVSRTFEVCFDDFCAARLGKALGKPEAAFFERRAQNWKNLWRDDIGFPCGRDSKGAWRPNFDPAQLGHEVATKDRGCDFTEGNAWQYMWHVMQDPEGLIARLGGKEAFVKKLDGLFRTEVDPNAKKLSDVTGLIGQYAHGNEPSHHVAYFYQFAGRPDRTAEIVREVFDRFYGVTPDGLCGNDDCGQMSAWYLFSAMGFYPFNPCGGEYVIGAPQVPMAQVKVGGEGEQRTFKVLAKNLSKANKYVKSVTLNGKPIADWKIRHADIVRGGELIFEMTDSAKAGWKGSRECGGDWKLKLGLSAADNRRAIQRAVDKASAAGGGRVEIPIGTWTTGSIQLKDGVELHLPQGATLKGSVDRRDYNANDAFPENRWSDDEEWSGGHLVWARCARDISITGLGVIDGNGPAFFGSCDEETRFPHYKYGLKLHPTDREWFRPGIMVAFFRCQNVRVEDVKLVRTTAWTCHFRCCDGVTLRNVTVDADRTIANSDGLSIDCTRNVVIEGCTLLTGDDGVPIRASCPFHAATNFCENIVIRNCDIWSCNYGIRFGVGTGLIRNVRVSDVRVHEAANAGIGFTPAWKAGPRNCYIEDVEIDNCTLLECAHPVIAGSANDSMVRNVTIRNCRFETLLPNLIWGGPRCSMSFENCTRMPIERVKVRHQSGWHEEEIRKGWSTFAEVRDDASAVRMTNCRVGEARNTAWMRGSVGISVHWTATLPCADGSEISFEEAVRGFDVERFVSVLAAVGAQHLIFTVAHARQILPMPNAALDAIAPGRTSSRDLFGEILDACGKRGIRVIAYYNHSCNGAHPEVVKWMRQCGCPHTPDGCGDEARFETNICAIVREISQRYGRKISGWWFDSAYSVDSRGPYVGL